MRLRIGVIMYQTSYTKGQELVAERMVREFRRLGHEAYLITSAYHDWNRVISEKEIEERGGYILSYDEKLEIPIIRLDGYIASWPPRRIFLKNFISSLRRLTSDLKLNVLITHSTLWNGPYEAAQFLAWKMNIVREGLPEDPIVFCHMSHFQEPDDQRYMIEERSYRKAWNDTILPRILEISNLVIVSSPMEAEYMKKYGVESEKMFLFAGGVDSDILESIEPERVIEKGRKKIVTYLGTVEERKNALTVVEIAKRFQNVDEVLFVIAGKLEGDYARKVKDEVSNLKNLVLLGEVSEAQKAYLLKNSFVNINMSKSEALGITQLEFMYFGVPVISSGSGGQSWIVKSGYNGILVNGPDDIEGACNALLKLLKDKSFWSRLSKNAREFSSKFAISKITYDLEKTLLRIIGEKSGPRLRLRPLERAIESLTSNGARIIITTERLIVIKRRDKSTSVPYDDITRITKEVSVKWWILAFGLIVFLFHLVVNAFEASIPYVFGLFSGYLPHSGIFSFVSTSPLFSSFVLGICIAFFLLSKREVLVIYSKETGKITLSRKLERAIRIADRFTPKDLLKEINKS